MKQILAFLVIFFAVNTVIANTTLSGKVIDKSSKEALAFVNIGIEGTLIGTASDVDGAFTLKIPESHLNKKLYFSAIGYENLLVNLSTLKDGSVTELTSLSYGLDDIEISTQSKVLYKIVRDASKAIAEQFIAQPYNYNMLYRNEQYKADTLWRKRNATLLLNDKSGYGSKANAFINRNYNFTNVERNFEVNSLTDGTTLVNDLLSFDFARTNNNILDVSNLNEFDLELVEETIFNNDSVWVIAYKLGSPDLTKTGGLYTSLYEGKLYISKSLNIPYKVETNIKASIQSYLGRNIASAITNSKKDVYYHITTSYQKHDNYFSLDNITINANFIDTDGSSIQQNASLLVTEVKTLGLTKVNARQYFEGMVSDPDFWIGLNQ